MTKPKNVLNTGNNPWNCLSKSSYGDKLDEGLAPSINIHIILPNACRADLSPPSQPPDSGCQHGGATSTNGPKTCDCYLKKMKKYAEGK